MEIQTARFGTINVADNKILHFPHSIPGFTEREFALLRVEEHLPFMWLQAVHDPDLAFVIVDPYLFFPEYAPVVGEGDRLFLELTDEVMVFSIVSIQEEITLNLLAPVVINPHRNRGKQVILEATPYSVRHSLPTEVMSGQHPPSRSLEPPAPSFSEQVALAE